MDFSQSSNASRLNILSPSLSRSGSRAESPLRAIVREEISFSPLHRKRKRYSDNISGIDGNDLVENRPNKIRSARDKEWEEMNENFEFLEKFMEMHFRNHSDREPYESRALDPEELLNIFATTNAVDFVKKLALYVDILPPITQDGESTSGIKLTTRYTKLVPDFKIRLLKIIPREEIAIDIIQNHFSQMADDLKIELMEWSPIQKMSISREIFKTFNRMVCSSRLKFVSKCPLQFATEVILVNNSSISISECLRILQRLPDSSRNIALKKDIALKLWERKSEFHYPDDFLNLAIVSESFGGNGRTFHIIETMAALASSKGNFNRIETNRAKFGIMTRSTRDGDSITNSDFIPMILQSSKRHIHHLNGIGGMERVLICMFGSLTRSQNAQIRVFRVDSFGKEESYTVGRISDANPWISTDIANRSTDQERVYIAVELFENSLNRVHEEWQNLIDFNSSSRYEMIVLYSPRSPNNMDMSVPKSGFKSQHSATEEKESLKSRSQDKILSCRLLIQSNETFEQALQRCKTYFGVSRGDLWDVHHCKMEPNRVIISTAGFHSSSITSRIFLLE